ncbi:MAG: hypothetical protein R3344_04210 [Acidobacteriota bacterium]|nr:hypothetical protein [Acidobacteriota bacterium]
MKKGPASGSVGPFAVLAGGWRAILLVVGAGLFFCLPLGAEPVPQSAHPDSIDLFGVEELHLGAVRLASTVRLDPVEPSEMLADGVSLSISEGRYRPGGFGPDGPAFDAQIVRRLPAIWWMRLRDPSELDSLGVRLDLTSVDGSRDRLGHSLEHESEIRVTVRPLDPVVSRDDVDSVVIEGGALLILDLSEVRSAGRYTGTLTVTVDHF